MEYTRAKARGQGEDTLGKQATPEKDPMEGYVPRPNPRKGYPGEKPNGERIRSNLNRINKRYVATPYRAGEGRAVQGTPEGSKTAAAGRRATRIPTARAENSAISRRRVAGSVKTRVEMVTEKNAARKPFPLGVIFCCIAVTALFMYMISLGIQIDDHSSGISDLKGEIGRINDEITSLDLRLQNQYDLDEIERIAVEEYGMVRSDQLPKKYVSLAGDDVVEITKPEESSGLGNLLSVFAALFGFGE